jgi:hypothetical protein
MPFLKINPKYFAEHQKRVTLLSKLNDPLIYSKEMSLAIYQSSVEALKATTDAKNKQLEILNALTLEHNAALAKADKDLSTLRAFIGADKGKNSEEYVFAGGIRQSDAIEQARQTRKQKQQTLKSKEILIKTE